MLSDEKRANQVQDDKEQLQHHLIKVGIEYEF
jgi:hypothetical protein